MEGGGEGKPPVGPTLDQPEKPGRTLDKLAKMANVGHGTVGLAAKVKKRGTSELFEAVKEGKIPVNIASEISELPKEEQEQILQEPTEQIRERAKEIKKSKKLEKVKEEKVSEAVIPAPAPMGPKAYGKEMSGMLKGLSEF